MTFTCRKCGGHLYRRQADTIVCQACEARYRLVRRPAEPQPPPQIVETARTERPAFRLLTWTNVLSVLSLIPAAIITEYITGWRIASGPTEFVVGLLFLVVLMSGLVCFYFLPSVVAYVRGHHNLGAIIVVNTLLGWFFGIGWAVAMAWAMTSPAPVRLTNGEEIN